jgi:hypothetical protein
MMDARCLSRCRSEQCTLPTPWPPLTAARAATPSARTRQIVSASPDRLSRRPHRDASRLEAMLLNVTDDRHFQRYLDKVERALYVEMAGVLSTGIRLQVNRNSIQAADYLIKRGGKLLLRFYKRIYRDQYRAVLEAERALETKAHSNFMKEQLRHLEHRAGEKIRTSPNPSATKSTRRSCAW